MFPDERFIVLRSACAVTRPHFAPGEDRYLQNTMVSKATLRQMRLACASANCSCPDLIRSAITTLIAKYDRDVPLNPRATPVKGDLTIKVQTLILRSTQDRLERMAFDCRCRVPSLVRQAIDEFLDGPSTPTGLAQSTRE